MLNEDLDYDIISVKRKSDGEIFTVGDETTEGKIRGFRTYDGTIDVYANWKYSIHSLEKIPNEKLTS
jgi:hypothetical protein